MGLKNQLLKVIEWSDNSQDIMAYKFPMPENAEIMMGSQLVVRESQIAIFLDSGRIADVFVPGRYKLDTGNMPLLTKLRSWKYGFNSPFKAEVYYLNTRQFINMKWGTTNPIMMRDADFGMVRFRGYGVFSFKVDEAVVFLRELLGSAASFKTGDVIEHLKRSIVSGITEAVAASNVPALDLATKYTDIGNQAAKIISPRFEAMGIKLSSMVIENLSLTEDSEKAMEKRTSMNVIGDVNKYTQFQAADAMMEVAKNSGSGNGMGMNMAAMGMNMGVGMGVTSMFGENLARAQQAGAQQAALDIENKKAAEAKAAIAAIEAAKPVACSKCGTDNPKSSKFCQRCGEVVAEKKRCMKCGAGMNSFAKFCPECGEKCLLQNVCRKCGLESKPGTKFCPDCGNKL